MKKERWRIVWVREIGFGRECPNEGNIVGITLEPLNIEAELRIHNEFWQVNL